MQLDKKTSGTIYYDPDGDKETMQQINDVYNMGTIEGGVSSQQNGTELDEFLK